MTPKLVIFDCDGVLVDSEHTTNEAIAQILTRHGYPISADDCMARFAGLSLEDITASVNEHGGTLPDDWEDELNEAAFPLLRAGTPVIEGIPELLETLDQAGIATAVASNGPLAKMEITLGPSGMFDHFKGRIFSAESLPAKPAPDMLLAAVAQAGVTPADAVMIDDNPAGTHAGVAAGTRTIGFGDPMRLRAPGVEIVSSMTEVAGLLGL